MDLPRRWLFRMLLLVATSSGILLMLYSSAGQQSPETQVPARNMAYPRAFFDPKPPNSENRKSRLCQHSLSLAIQKDRRFRSLFDLSHEVIASTLRLLKSPESGELFGAPRKLPLSCIRCAVVGNGGILNGSRQGQKIDAHDYVFRLNGAITEGFERDVGTKTSFYGFTVNTMKNSLISYAKLGFTSVPQGQNLRYIFIPSSIRDYLMLRSAILGVPVPEGPDKGDRS